MNLADEITDLLNIFLVIILYPKNFIKLCPGHAERQITKHSHAQLKRVVITDVLPQFLSSNHAISSRALIGTRLNRAGSANGIASVAVGRAVRSASSKSL
jgi:hypothetical protein